MEHPQGDDGVTVPFVPCGHDDPDLYGFSCEYFAEFFYRISRDDGSTIYMEARCWLHQFEPDDAEDAGLKSISFDEYVASEVMEG